MKTSFFGTQTGGVLLYNTTAVHIGRNTQVWDSEVTGRLRPRLRACSGCTQMILAEDP